MSPGADYWELRNFINFSPHGKSPKSKVPTGIVKVSGQWAMGNGRSKEKHWVLSVSRWTVSDWSAMAVTMERSSGSSLALACHALVPVWHVFWSVEMYKQSASYMRAQRKRLSTLDK